MSSPAAAAGAGAAVLLAVAGLLGDLPDNLRAWCVTAGFLALAGWALLARRGYVAALFALFFAGFGGLSAVIAVAPGGASSGAPIPQLSSMTIMGILDQAGVAAPPDGAEAFGYALRLTILCGVVATLAAAFPRPREAVPAAAARRAGSAELIRAGQVLVALGFLGMALAGARFILTQPLDAGLWTAVKSIWSGGSYLLLLAMFAVPGFGVWLSGLLQLDGPARPEWVRFLAAAGLYCAVSLPTGQRGFVVQVAIVVVGVLVVGGRIRVRTLVALGIVGVIGLGVTQAARNAAREDDSLSLSGIVHRLEPDRLRTLYGSQLASFAWTWDVARYRDAIDPVPDTFVSVLLKPVPRQLYPDKIQGFGEEFTRRLYPSAAEQQVAFAAPLVAEADAAYRWPGALVVLGLFGAAAGWAERRLRASDDPLRGVWGVALAWSIFALLRGDLANATVVVAAWVVPLAGATLALRRRPGGGLPLPRRVARRREKAVVA